MKEKETNKETRNEILREITAYYRAQGAPRDQTALIACLREAQTACGGTLTGDDQQTVAQVLGVGTGYLQAVAKRIPDLRLGGGAHTLTVCGGAACQGRGAALRRYLEDELGARDGQTFLNGTWMYRKTGCMHACRTAPNVKIDGKPVENITLAGLKRRLGVK